jgi:hypothetical protein
MSSRHQKNVDLTPRLLVIAFVLLGLMGVARVVGFAQSEDIAAIPVAKASEKPKSPLRHAAEYLWGRQAEDGGWHSEKYGLLRSGQALTPFVLHSLLMVPEEVLPRRSDEVDRALAFIRRHTNERGVLGVADPDVLEYPNYATAYALRCLELVGAEQDRELVARMRAYLQAEQFTETRGINPQSLAYGGWGFGGDLRFGETGHMDIAHSRRVLQALRESQVADPDVYWRAERFLSGVQRHPSDPRPQPRSADSTVQISLPNVANANYDGGFYFSPVVLAANKGREARNEQGAVVGFRSYATSTCDGVLSLLACGVTPDDPRLRDATNWLAKHHDLNYPEGVPTKHPEPWGEAIRFYHLAARAEVNRRLNLPGDWRAEIDQLLVRDQRADGSFVNEASHLMKEDDPYLCTALAVVALTHAAR